jgi:hypothetical protein
LTELTSPGGDAAEGSGKRLSARQIRTRKVTIAVCLILVIGGSLAAWPLTGSPVAVAYTLLACGAAGIAIGVILLSVAMFLAARRGRRQ